VGVFIIAVNLSKKEFLAMVRETRTMAIEWKEALKQLEQNK